MNDQPYHIPALLNETLEALSIRPDGVYVDCTFGGGGHSREILARLGPGGRLLGFDQDEDALKNALQDDRFTFVRGNFRFLRNYLQYYGINRVDGILADLGVSFHHFDEADRGFSFRYEGELDMRMNRSGGITAAGILNTYPENAIADLLYNYGEIKQSRRIAAAIVRYRQQNAFSQIAPFVEVIRPFFSREKEKKEMARVFQALRIEVNGELEALKSLLYQSVDMLKPEGRLAIITYHSLEDRLVKHFFRTGNMEGEAKKDFFGNVIAPLEPVYNKVIVASDDEVERNPRSRSAKLRVATPKK